MFFLYSLLYTISFLILMPRFLYDFARKGKYAAGFRERLGILRNFKQDSRPVLWLHAVSVGEANAAKPLVEKLLEKYDFRIVISTTTETGQNLARRIFAKKAERVFYMPFDWRFSVRRALKMFKPNVILIMETELWFNFINEAGKSGAQIFLVNGRISEKSMRGYMWISRFVRRVFRRIDLALMQDAADAKRLLKLGVRPSKVKVTGNVKFDQTPEPSYDLMTDYFRERFNFGGDEPLIVAASTHDPEEEWILEAFKAVWKSEPKKLPRLVIAPRHPERFEKVAALIEKTGFEWNRRSSGICNKDETAEIILLDSIGELRAVFSLAEIVFIGGSLIPHGGQNILEPAMTGNAIVTGYYTSNFKAITEEFVNKNALIQLPKLKADEIPETLAEVFKDLLENRGKREALRHNSRVVIKHNIGAVEKTFDYLKPFLEVQSNHLPK